MKFRDVFPTCVLLIVATTSLAGANTRIEDQPRRQLSAGQSVGQTLDGGKMHVYEIRLEAGQFLDAVVEQQGIDVVLTLFGPDGAKLLKVDSPNGERGAELASFIAETPGTYLLEVRSLEPTAKPGRYTATVTVRPATDRDRAAARARSLSERSMALFREHKAKEAIALAGQALAELEGAYGRDHQEVANSLMQLAWLYDQAGAYSQAELRIPAKLNGKSGRKMNAQSGRT